MGSKKTEKQIMNLLYGVNTKNNALLVIVYICVLAMAACIWSMWHFNPATNTGKLLLFAVVCMFLFIYATALCVSGGKHVKELKEKYRQLSEEEEAEVRAIAEGFDGKGLGLSEHFVYGFMARVNDYRKAKDIIVFEYIPVSQIVFIDTLKSKEREEKEKDFQRKTQAALIGAGVAYMKASRRVRTGLVGNAYNAPVVSGDTTNVSNFICIELKNGSKYRAVGDAAFLDKVKFHMNGNNLHS